jgi:hypothetical protein
LTDGPGLMVRGGRHKACVPQAARRTSLSTAPWFAHIRIGTAAGCSWIQDLERIRSGPPVPGYEAFLIGEGYEPFEARLMGHAVNNLGKRLAREREAERTLAGVLRAVIKGEERGPLLAISRV